MAGGAVTNNYSGVLAQGLSASTTNVATGGSIYYQGNNITIDMTTNANGSHTMNFSAGAAGGGAAYSGYSEWPANWGMSTQSTVVATGSGHLKFFNPTGSLAISKIECPMYFSIASNTASTQSATLSGYGVIYSLNGNTLTPVVGNSFASTWVWGSAQAISSVHGPRLVSFNIVTTLGSGQYWFGARYNTATGGQAQANTIAVVLNSRPAPATPWTPLNIATVGSVGEPNFEARYSGTVITHTSMPINASGLSVYSTAGALGRIPILFNNG